jgi:predicted permease
LIGSAAGLLFARWGRDLVLRFLPQAADVQVTLDGPVLGFSLLLGLSAGLLFGLAPALQATRPDMTPVLKDDNLSGGPKRFNLRRGLVVVQVALSLMLLSGAGVFLRSLRNLEQLDPGFVRENVLVFSLDPRLKGYTAVEARLLFDRLIERLKLLPGVRAAGVADFAPLGMHTGNTIYVEGYQPRADEPRSDPGVGLVSPDYFATMGIPVIFGREFSARDSAAAPKVAIVNQTFARHYFGNQNPLGKRLGYRDGIFDMEVVGVVRDSKYGGLREEATRMLYLAAAQRPYGGGVVHVRTAGDAEVLGPLARAEVRALDRDLPVNDLTTVRLELDRALTQDRLVAALSTLFSALALVLSAVGLYGVMSYAVSRRTREIGIRMALGAERGNIARQVLQEVAMLMLAGVLLGLPAAYAVLKLVSGMLFGLSSTDTATTVLAVAVLGLAALIAAWLPARRAARVDPMVALRYVG